MLLVLQAFFRVLRHDLGWFLAVIVHKLFTTGNATRMIGLLAETQSLALILVPH